MTGRAYMLFQQQVAGDCHASSHPQKFVSVADLLLRPIVNNAQVDTLTN